MTNRPFKPGDDVKAGKFQARILAVTDNGMCLGEILIPQRSGNVFVWRSAVWNPSGTNIFCNKDVTGRHLGYIDLRHDDLFTTTSGCTRFSLTKWDTDAYRLGTDVALEDLTREQWTSLMEFLIECYRKESTQ